MSDIVIAAEKLSKVYRLGRASERSESVVGALKSAVSAPFRNLRDLWKLDAARQAAVDGSSGQEDSDYLWALRDVSFEIGHGEVVGIIGRNGAGKSTLLKILSRVAEPTSGRVRVRGRLAALLEVGTGFHPELSGRENVYLNGTILGMSKQEIDRKFDEIVEFSGVDRFLDTPVKRYSSGMKVRLGFAVAAHLDPDVLIVDEVLAVGDAEFQRKCIAKMRDVAEGGGRTVLFVSHQMTTISNLCTRCIYLEAGRVKTSGPAVDVIRSYLAEGDLKAAAVEFAEDPEKPAQYRSARVVDRSGRPSGEMTVDDGVVIELDFEVRQAVPGLFLTWTISDPRGTAVVQSDIRDAGPRPEAELGPGRHDFRVELPVRLLAPGVYSLTVAAASRRAFVDIQREVLQFRLEDISTVRGNKRAGFCALIFPWERVPAGGNQP